MYLLGYIRGVPFFSFCLVLFFAVHQKCRALDLPDWTGGVFLDLAGQYYLLPDFSGVLNPSMAERYGVSGGPLKPSPGFRGGLGYEWKKFRFSLETGYTYIKGTNPLVLDIHLVPLVCKGGYVFSLGNFSLIPLLGAGPVFVQVNHYETAIDLLLEKQIRSTAAGFLLYGGLRAGWSFIPALTLYAGGGIDCIVETGGMIPLPALELGITVKPLLFGKQGPGPAAQVKPEAVEEPAAEVPEAAAVEEPAAEAPEAEAVRFFRNLYFPADAAVPVSSHLVELDAAGEFLGAFPAAALRLRGYTAPYGSPGARRALSEARVRFCAAYLAEHYGIGPERIRLEWYGAEKEPEAADGTDWRRRCVEIISGPDGEEPRAGGTDEETGAGAAGAGEAMTEKGGE
jgi:outer membrane protein OmpA-like peptidoglycan-associated protein